jgi:speckle-type POZ protein
VEEMPTDYPIISEPFEYRNEKLFSVSLNSISGQIEQNIQHPGFVLSFTSSNHHKIGLKLSKVLLTLTCPGMTESDSTEMKPKETPEEDVQKVFILHTGPLPLPVTITYYIHVNETLPNYRYELVDLLCFAQLWLAARKRQFTDFEFLVRGKVFPAHRAILAARSPVLANLLSEPGVDFHRIEDIDPQVFEQFLHFVYTGRLTTSAAEPQLLVVAERFQIDTLKKLCQNAARGSDSGNFVIDVSHS